MEREPWENFKETGMPLSIIIPWRSGNSLREESFKNMLNCLSVQETPESTEKITCEVIIVEHSRIDNINSSYVKTNSLIPQKIKHTEYPFINFKYIQLKRSVGQEQAFNKSWCMNVGVREAKYEHLIFIDADSLLGKDFIRTVKYEIRRQSYPKNQLMTLWNYLMKLNGPDEPIVRFVRPDITRALGGIWYSTKSFYWNHFGGMNENYAGYGGEDNDAFERAVYALKNCGSPDSYPAMVNYPLGHQYHPNEIQSVVVPLWLKTRNNPQEVINRLRSVKLGDLDSPTLIPMEDLLGN